MCKNGFKNCSNVGQKTEALVKTEFERKISNFVSIITL